MGSFMFDRIGDSSPEATNEVLEMYRFIVDKYANMVLPMPNSDVSAMDFLVQTLITQWNKMHAQC